jgi:hypothetical protein
MRCFTWICINFCCLQGQNGCLYSIDTSKHIALLDGESWSFGYWTSRSFLKCTMFQVSSAYVLRWQRLRSASSLLTPSERALLNQWAQWLSQLLQHWAFVMHWTIDKVQRKSVSECHNLMSKSNAMDPQLLLQTLV